LAVTSLAQANGVKKYYKHAVIAVLVVPPLLGVVGYFGNSLLLLSVVFGSFGGIIHDLLQNKGLLVYPDSSSEGVYLGAGLGALLGALSGFLAYATLSATSISDPKTLVIPLTWGLSLKGLADAATNQTISKVPATP
jgi:hypothetical protein